MADVHRKDREAILREGGVREPTPRELAEGSLLQQDLEGSPLKGRPLPGRLRNFRLSLHENGLVLQGCTPTYYAKQLAQHAVMTAIKLPIRANDITVG